MASVSFQRLCFAAAARGCSLGVVWMGPREAASEERAAAAALREDLAVVLPAL